MISPRPLIGRGTKMGVCTKNIYWTNYIPSDSLGLEIRVTCPIVWVLVNYLCKCLDSAVSNMPVVGQLSDNVLSNCPIFEQCYVQQSNGWFMLCPTVRWAVSWVSNSPMVGQSSVELSNGRIILFQIVQWLDSAVSNSPMHNGNGMTPFKSSQFGRVGYF